MKNKKLKNIIIGFFIGLMTLTPLSLLSKINISNNVKVVKEFNFDSYKYVTKLSGGQDGAIYNDYLFSFGSYGSCNVYSMNDYSLIGSFQLDSNGTTDPHSNSVSFGTEYYDRNDEFPLLYSNIYNNNSSLKGVTNVYRLTRENNNFSSELVQVIKIGFSEDSNKWASGVRPYGNFVIDTDKNDYWSFVMDGTTNSTKFFRFDLPKLNDGIYDENYKCNVITLEYNDILTQFSTEYFNFVQGATYYNGKIYSSEGFTNDTTNIPTIRVVDLKKEKVTKVINLVSTHALSVEPEFIDEYKDILYYKDVNGSLYSFNLIED